ncbi:unnamed protein product [Heligmosomoides polygyrus]|uniref:Uncharacterized protein n=1 Tax=Heligmosomoides polygyrus TaxID=6339 RepID=A0A183G176_HELPZ|nr:unnamed protein product [Heligmosomoides polygyrus]
MGSALSSDGNLMVEENPCRFGVATADKTHEARMRWYGHVLYGKEDSVGKLGLDTLKTIAFCADRVGCARDSTHVRYESPPLKHCPVLSYKLLNLPVLSFGADRIVPKSPAQQFAVSVKLDRLIRSRLRFACLIPQLLSAHLPRPSAVAAAAATRACPLKGMVVKLFRAAHLRQTTALRISDWPAETGLRAVASQLPSAFTAPSSL